MPRKPDGRAPGSVREPGGLRLRLAQPSYLPGPSRWRWQCGPRARDHVACRWLHRPVFFFFFGLQAQAPRFDPRTALPLAGKKRGGTWSRHAERTRNCRLRKTRPRDHEHIHKPVHGCNSKLASKPIEFWVTYGFYSVYTLNQ